MTNGDDDICILFYFVTETIQYCQEKIIITKIMKQWKRMTVLLCQMFNCSVHFISAFDRRIYLLNTHRQKKTPHDPIYFFYPFEFL